MDLFMHEACARVGANSVLRKVDALLDWAQIEQLLERAQLRSGLGPQGIGDLVLFKCFLLGQWHGLSDPKLEESRSQKFKQSL